MRTFTTRTAETETTPESDALASVVTGIGDVKTIMYSLCIVVLLTVLLIAANSMAMMVRDRITEVAVMRALGFARVHVVALLLTEATLIGLSGGIVGAAAALMVLPRRHLARRAHRRTGIHGGRTGHCCMGGSRRAGGEYSERRGASDAGSAHPARDGLQEGGVKRNVSATGAVGD